MQKVKTTSQNVTVIGSAWLEGSVVTRLCDVSSNVKLFANWNASLLAGWKISAFRSSISEVGSSIIFTHVSSSTNFSISCRSSAKKILKRFYYDTFVPFRLSNYFQLKGMHGVLSKTLPLVFLRLERPGRCRFHSRSLSVDFSHPKWFGYRYHLQRSNSLPIAVFYDWLVPNRKTRVDLKIQSNYL